MFGGLITPASWNPGIATPQAWWKPGGYVDAGGGTFNWTPAVNNSGVAAIWADATTPPDVHASGTPSFVRANGDVLSTTGNWGNYIGTGAMTIALVVDVTNITLNAISWQNEPIIFDTGFYCGLYLRNSVTPIGQLIMSYYDTTDRLCTHSLAATSGLLNIVAQKTSGGLLRITTDGGTNWTNGDTASTLGGGSTMRLGKSIYGGLNGRIKSIATWNRQLTDTEVRLAYVYGGTLV